MNEQALQDAIQSMELLDIYLNEGQLQRSHDFDLHFPAEAMRQQSKLSVSGDILSKEADDAGAHQLYLRAFVSFGLRFVPKANNDSNDQSPLAELTATFAVLYQMSQELPDDVIQQFIQHNVVHNAWPFWREHAIRVFSEAKLPRPQIGLFKPSASSDANP